MHTRPCKSPMAAVSQTDLDTKLKQLQAAFDIGALDEQAFADAQATLMQQELARSPGGEDDEDSQDEVAPPRAVTSPRRSMKASPPQYSGWVDVEVGKLKKKWARRFLVLRVDVPRQGSTARTAWRRGDGPPFVRELQRPLLLVISTEPRRGGRTESHARWQVLSCYSEEVESPDVELFSVAAAECVLRLPKNSRKVLVVPRARAHTHRACGISHYRPPPLDSPSAGAGWHLSRGHD